MNIRTPMKIGFDGLAVLLVSAGVTMVTTSATTEKMAVGILLIILGILSYIVRHTWNQKILNEKYGEPEKTEDLNTETNNEE